MKTPPADYSLPLNLVSLLTHEYIDFNPEELTTDLWKLSPEGSTNEDIIAIVKQFNLGTLTKIGCFKAEMCHANEIRPKGKKAQRFKKIIKMEAIPEITKYIVGSSGSTLAKIFVGKSVLQVDNPGSHIKCKFKGYDPTKLKNVMIGISNGIKLVEILKQENQGEGAKSVISIENFKNAAMLMNAGANFHLAENTKKASWCLFLRKLEVAAEHCMSNDNQFINDPNADVYAMFDNFLKAGADSNQSFMGRIIDSLTPLHLVLKYNLPKVQILLDYGAEVNSKSLHNVTPLHLAVGRGDKDIVKLLLDYGAEANNKDDDGDTTLQWTKDLEIVKLLLDYGAEANSKNNQGNTALHKAVSIYPSLPKINNSISLVNLLLENGANLTLTNLAGQTALDKVKQLVQNFKKLHHKNDQSIYNVGEKLIWFLEEKLSPEQYQLQDIVSVNNNNPITDAEHQIDSVHANHSVQDLNVLGGDASE